MGLGIVADTLALGLEFSVQVVVLLWFSFGLRLQGTMIYVPKPEIFFGQTAAGPGGKLHERELSPAVSGGHLDGLVRAP